jgi:hypothetical protein
MIGNFYECKAPYKTWKRKTGRIIVRLLQRWRKNGKRNVLVECHSCGYRWTRPFRGMKRIKP